MVKINRVHMNYENPLIGAEEMPQFGWEIESSKRDVVQKSYQLQISENEKFEELVYDSGVVWSEESAPQREPPSTPTFRTAVIFFGIS